MQSPLQQRGTVRLLTSTLRWQLKNVVLANCKQRQCHQLIFLWQALDHFSKRGSAAA